LFGDSSVGKTSLTQRYLTGIFKERYQLTIGTDFYVKKTEFNGNKLSMNIWDFAGEERFRFLMPGSLMGSDAVIFMYDITRYKTLENLDDWIGIYESTIKKQAIKPITIIVGGKTDLDDIKVVPRERAILMVKKHGFDGFIECSSKNGSNVEEVFENIALLILKKQHQINIERELKVLNL